jgi:hypothetical protein
MPLNTVMPIDLRALALAPAPVATTRGATPRMKANLLHRTGDGDPGRRRRDVAVLLATGGQPQLGRKREERAARRCATIVRHDVPGRSCRPKFCRSFGSWS